MRYRPNNRLRLNFTSTNQFPGADAHLMNCLRAAPTLYATKCSILKELAPIQRYLPREKRSSSCPPNVNIEDLVVCILRRQAKLDSPRGVPARWWVKIKGNLPYTFDLLLSPDGRHWAKSARSMFANLAVHAMYQMSGRWASPPKLH